MIATIWPQFLLCPQSVVVLAETLNMLPRILAAGLIPPLLAALHFIRTRVPARALTLSWMSAAVSLPTRDAARKLSLNPRSLAVRVSPL